MNEMINKIRENQRVLKDIFEEARRKDKELKWDFMEQNLQSTFLVGKECPINTNSTILKLIFNEALMSDNDLNEEATKEKAKISIEDKITNFIFCEVASGPGKDEERFEFSLDPGLDGWKAL